MLLMQKTTKRWLHIRNPKSKWPELTLSKSKKDATRFSKINLPDVDMNEFKIFRK